MSTTSEIGTSPIFDMPVADLRPASVNDAIYKPVDPDDPEIAGMARDFLNPLIGQRQPIAVTSYNVIVSGHRRYAAAKRAGLRTVRAFREPFASTDPNFVTLLVAANGYQREKSVDEVMREGLIRADPEEAHQRLLEFRKASRKPVASVVLHKTKKRAAISGAKGPFLAAIRSVINSLENYWPLSDRQIHYGLLNDPPLIHASKPHSRYANDAKSYKSLTELLTRARFAGEIPMDVIHDPTRPVSSWNVFRGKQEFIDWNLRWFLRGLRRDLQQSQPDHIEIVGEKNTIEGIISPVAEEYGIRYTIGRGYASLPPRYEMAERFRKSGKGRLLILFLSDFDPEGMSIPEAFARSMRDDFGVKSATAFRVALTHEQVVSERLPHGAKAKAGSSRRAEFVKNYGEYVYELESVPPDRLQQFLRDAIEKVIDRDALNAELQMEKEDEADLEVERRRHADYFIRRRATAANSD